MPSTNEGPASDFLFLLRFVLSSYLYCLSYVYVLISFLISAEPWIARPPTANGVILREVRHRRTQTTRSTAYDVRPLQMVPGVGWD